ncbi:hypothetical protein U3C68_000288 [Cronobacter sakazakii]|nr:hypothetical protein [Cronobacter sakazakii]
MTTLDPRQLWRGAARTGNLGACKTTHLMHAMQKSNKFEYKLAGNPMIFTFILSG